jgi:catechol 2,3-dioxygenase-like lactoylglutathione lyase family enzyme
MRGALLAAMLLAAATAAAGQGLVERVDAVGMTVSDLDRSVAFFTGVLGCREVGRAELAGDAVEHLLGVFGARVRVARLLLGDEELQLMQFVAPPGRPFPADTRGNDRWFQHVAIVVRDMEAGYRRLREHGIASASKGPQRLPDWNPNAGGIEAFYFHDPDGHFLELIHFPPGKGDPRWQRPGGDLFQGIDHTAITVADTDASLSFYRDRLGLRVAGASENWGVEQEHLNNVFGARLRITALRAGPEGAATGPGVELLEYLAPGGGRPAPGDLATNDLAHWQTLLRVADPDAADRALRPAHPRYVSPGAVKLGAPEAGALRYGAGVLLRDPDGHALLLESP